MSRCVSNFVPTRMGSRALPSFTADLAPAQHKPPRQRTVLQQTTRPSELTTPQAVMRAHKGIGTAAMAKNAKLQGCAGCLQLPAVCCATFLVAEIQGMQLGPRTGPRRLEQH